MCLVADFFDALADETRRRMLALITHEGELCVCELHEALAVLQPKASRHLAILRDAQILSIRRDGTWIFYRVNPALPDWAVGILHTLDPVWQAIPEYQQDYQRLLAMENRPVRCCG
ncbi:MAG: metalloregulator ArsR/SmtB family transcription factor [Sulfuriferula sp.]|nr:metalloregulator ArsR/SmtB family transcription factor [Sulfuriferula sp.]